MNLTRRSHKEDALFVIALLVPAIFAGARYVESDRQITQIAQAQARTAVAVESHTPAPVLVAKADIGG
jgi:Flp pilus assembly protein TadG